MNRPKRILVAVLNWGLGHASRCIPLINELLRQSAQVELASDGRALQLLKLEFPELPIYQLPAYNIHYRYPSMELNMTLQIPKILRAVKQEHRQIIQLTRQRHIDIIISDNRYGCYSPSCFNVFMTHQLRILSSRSWVEIIINHLNHRLIRRFNVCWIPDLPDHLSLAGKLSRSRYIKNCYYLGVLSRMHNRKLPLQYEIIAVLSGPEPQRSILEKKIIAQLKMLSYRSLVVCGRPGMAPTTSSKGKLTVVPFLSTKALCTAMNQSEVVVSRSGYSTIMDLAHLGRKALLIPTPGQTEQEYLAKQFFDKGIFLYQKQRELNLEEGIENAKAFTGLNPEAFDSSLLEENIHSLLRKNGFH